MNKPELTNEVAEFLTTWNEYAEAVKAHRHSDFTYYGRDYLAIIAENADAQSNNIEKMEAIARIGARIHDMGASVAEAATEYQRNLRAWERNEEEERERPRKTWEAARDEYARELTATVKSLAIKIGRAESKAWSLTGDEREEAQARLDRLRAEKHLAEEMQNGVSFMRYRDHEGEEFTQQAVLDSIEARRQNFAWIVEQLIGQPA